MATRTVTVRMAALLAVTVVLFAPACDETHHFVSPPPVVVHGDGEVVEETRPIGGVTSVDLRGIGELRIRQGSQVELRVRAEENLLEHLKSDVQSGELVIWKDGVTLRNTRPIEYDLTVVDLERASLTGAGSIRGTSLDTGPLTIRSPGVGNIELVDLSAPSLDVESSGVGEVVVSGSVQEQAVRLRGMGSFNGRDLDSAEADVVINDGGSATVRVRDRLNATIGGSGSVFYIGDPVVTRSIQGSGEVVKIGG